MITLALVGSNISHSKSAAMYKKLLKQELVYDLIDCQNSCNIPSLPALFNKYDGISITSPYKKHFLGCVSMSKSIAELNAINCIKKQGSDFIATNTDYLAIAETLDELVQSNGRLYVAILGNGVMSTITQKILTKKSIPFCVYARSVDGEIDELDLAEILAGQSKVKLILNSCSRNFIFKGTLPKDAIFWDFNYDFKPHNDSIPLKCKKYIDGLGLLKLQAHHAMRFWGIS